MLANVLTVGVRMSASARCGFQRAVNDHWFDGWSHPGYGDVVTPEGTGLGDQVTRSRRVAVWLVVWLMALLPACRTGNDTLAGRAPSPPESTEADAFSGMTAASPTGEAIGSERSTALDRPLSGAAANVAPRIDAMIAGVPAHVGVVVAYPDGTILYERDADRVFEAASLYKLAIMVELYHQREAGTLSFEDTVTLYPGYFFEDDSVYSADADVGAEVSIADALGAMITLSSNVAAQALLYTVGVDNVNMMLADLGLTHTELRWSPEPYPTGEPSPELVEPEPQSTEPGDTPMPDGEDAAETPEADAYAVTLVAARGFGPTATTAERGVDDAYNVSTPADITRLYTLLLRGEVISPDVSREMLDLLAAQEINDRLPAGLPEGTRVAHKTGNLPDVVHDAGVIYAPAGPVIVTVMADEVEDEWAVVELIRSIGLVAYEATS